MLEILGRHTREADITKEKEAHYRMSNTDGTKDLRWQKGEKDGWRNQRSWRLWAIYRLI